MSIENGVPDFPRVNPRYGIPEVYIALEDYDELEYNKSRMNPVIKVMWTTALRSGDFTQGTKFLTRVEDDGTEFDCCLGVLNKLGHVPSKPSEIYVDDSDNPITVLAYTYVDTRFPVHDNKGTLDMDFAIHCGLNSANPMFPGLFNRQGYMMDATTLNDEGFTFDQIADLIDYFL